MNESAQPSGVALCDIFGNISKGGVIKPQFAEHAEDLEPCDCLSVLTEPVDAQASCQHNMTEQHAGGTQNSNQQCHGAAARQRRLVLAGLAQKAEGVVNTQFL